MSWLDRAMEISRPGPQKATTGPAKRPFVGFVGTEVEGFPENRSSCEDPSVGFGSSEVESLTKNSSSLNHVDLVNGDNHKFVHQDKEEKERSRQVLKVRDLEKREDPILSTPILSNKTTAQIQPEKERMWSGKVLTKPPKGNAGTKPKSEPTKLPKVVSGSNSDLELTELPKAGSGTNPSSELTKLTKAQTERWKAVAKKACSPYSNHITADQLLARLAPEDLADLESMSDPIPYLRSFACSLVWTVFRKAGIAPPDWDCPATCDRCGPVFLWAPISVAGCPWCWNRLHGLPIPRPTAAKPTKGKGRANAQVCANPIGATSAHRRTPKTNNEGNQK